MDRSEFTRSSANLMDARIPSILHPLFQDYIDLVDRELPDRISACYLEGSLALGGFDPQLSDIDFVAVLNGKATLGDFESIQNIHKMIEGRYSRWKFEGRYLQPEDLGRSDAEVEPFPNYHDGKLSWSTQFGLSSITWWILKNRGIAVFGPPPQAFGYSIDMELLIQKQLENLNSYWASWTKKPLRILTLLSDWGIQWAVLGVLRPFYTLHEREMTTKIKAGEYALEHLPERWHAIIREAIALRGDPQRSYYRSRTWRAIDAYQFIRIIIKACNDYPG